MDYNEFKRYVDAASFVDGVVDRVQKGMYPWTDGLTATRHAAAIVTGAVTTNNGKNHHTVVVSYHRSSSGAEYNIWCGDKFLEGQYSADDVRAHIAEAAAQHPGVPAMAGDLAALQGVFPKSTGCHFWTAWAKDKSVCKHCKTFLDHLNSHQPRFMDELEDLYNEKTAAAAGTTPASAVSDRYELPSLAFRVPVLFEGDRGAGKTTAARRFARENRYVCVECQGHEGIEVPDLLGHLVPYSPTQMVWKDGPLTEAFRKATKGKVVLVIDELLRIPQRQLSVLLTPFSPDEGVYRLRTGRIVSVEDGVGQEEVLEVPIENLCVIATTNVGAGYAVDDYDPALAERFLTIRLDTTDAGLKAILADRATAKGFALAVGEKAFKFFESMTKAEKQGIVHAAPTTRTMTRAFDLAFVESDVKRGLRSQMLLWVARDSDGKPVEAQVKKVEALLSTAFA